MGEVAKGGNENGNFKDKASWLRLKMDWTVWMRFVLVVCGTFGCVCMTFAGCRG